jgi:anti-sigma regulatory factor (Ser/Thr protein kinase)
MDPLTLPAILESLEPLVQYVLSAAAAAGLDRKASYRLRLAVDEIATNIITHGYADAHTAGDVVVSARVDDEQLVITLEDWAPPFDPRVQADPEHIGKPSDERPIGGLGVFLALKSADAFDYEYRDNKNRNILAMSRPPSSTTANTARTDL